MIRGMIGCWLCCSGILWAVEPPASAKATPEALRQISALRLPEGMKAELFAEDPQLGSPVAIGLDEQGRVYVAEEYRFNRGTEENRTRPFLLEDDLQIRTLDERLKMFQKYADRFEGGMDWFSKYADQVRQLTDSDGDGRADRSKVFAGGFNGPLDGLAAGVMARDGNVYLTCIPSLWLLRDEDGDGVAEVRQPLLTGFGVNAGFLGHDLHGLCWGPDGKLYFSVGDRGFDVTTREGARLSGPRTGAVFRCEPDGTQLEVVHRGLRNPQELAFDDFGNLFAADNNCDKGDHSRLVYIVEGGESGWNMAYQSLADPYLTGPWHAEKLWHLAHPGQPAYIVPPVGKLGAGPSGFCYYPGTGLPGKYRGHFFMCNYTGNGGVEAIAVKPQGAGFEITSTQDFIKPVFASDADFGYDGKMYVSDFVALDWNGASKGGRIYSVYDPTLTQQAAVQQTKRLFQEGFEKRSADELLGLLSHPDQRVRQRSQFALAKRGAATAKQLLNAAHANASLLARLHAIWALGQRDGEQPEIQAGLLSLLDDPAPEIRAQAAKVFGQQRWKQADSKLTQMLSDDSPRVRFFAAQSLGLNGHQDCFPALVKLIEENADADPHLRHAAVIALHRLQQSDRVAELTKHASPSVRLVALLVMRRHSDPLISQLLNDSDPLIVAEAARAINDLPIDSETPKLAGLLARIDPATTPEPLLRRILNANFRLGTLEQAKAIVGVIMNTRVSPEMRAEALQMLSDWAEPPQRDRVTGFWRPLGKRPLEVVESALKDQAVSILIRTTGSLQIAAIQLFANLTIAIDVEVFFDWVKDPELDGSQRVAALHLLMAKKDRRVPELLKAALKDAAPELRAEARRLISIEDPLHGTVLLSNAWHNGSGQSTQFERQRALRDLPSVKHREVDRILSDVASELSRGEVPDEYKVDVIEAVRLRNDALGNSILDKFLEEQRKRDPILGTYRMALYGGDAETGKRIFRSHTIAQCVRCHKIQGQGGDAGPDLSELAKRANREHFLESMIDPNAKLAPGFGSVAYVLTDGRVVSGTLKGEDAKQVTALTADGKSVEIPVTDIEERTAAKSGMPPVGPILKLSEIRDVIEYLSTLK